MLEYLNDLQERFFVWCDNVVQDYIDAAAETRLKSWRPRKNQDGSYDLVFTLIARQGKTVKLAVPVPDEFHEFLEQEYFYNHPPDQDDDD